MNITFRTATEAYISLLRKFEQKLINHERTVEPTIKKEAPLTYYDIPKLVTETDKVLVLIAEVDGEPAVCGFARTKESEDCFTYTHHGYLARLRHQHQCCESLRKNGFKPYVQEMKLTK